MVLGIFSYKELSIDLFPDVDFYFRNLDGSARLAEAALGHCLARLEMPAPRVALGLALRGLARSCIDVSDGLVADLAHIGERSGVAA